MHPCTAVKTPGETSNEGAANRSEYFVSGGSVSVLSPPLASVGAQPRSTRGDFRLNNFWYLIDPSWERT